VSPVLYVPGKPQCRSRGTPETGIVAITLMCGAMVCFTRLDTCAKWLGFTLPAAQIVWARYLAAALIALAATRPLSTTSALRANSPWLQALRSGLLLGATVANVLALQRLQPSETATISFLTPIFVALMAGPLLGERVGAERTIAIAVGFLGVAIATRRARRPFSRSSSSLSPASCATPAM
jgi:drug/metabolite transporter (DMT)-like permease